jgi:HlyD family secretion protein
MRRDAEPTDRLLASGTVEATEARLGFEAAGALAEVAVREGDRVAAGALVARLESSEVEARRAQAAAQLAAARAALAELERGFRSEDIAQARAGVAAAAEQVADAERDASRARMLFDGGAVSREVQDKATMALEVARAQHTQTEERLHLLERGPRPEQIAAQRAQVDVAAAALQAAEAALAKRTLHAPLAGLVTTRHREPGEVVSPGSPVVTLLDPADRWVRIYVPENRIGAVRLGSEAVVLSDTYPDRRYRGEVTFVASEAEFTPKTVQTREERVRLVYAVDVRVLEDPGYELKPGMPVDVELPLAPARLPATTEQPPSSPAPGQR